MASTFHSFLKGCEQKYVQLSNTIVAIIFDFSDLQWIITVREVGGASLTFHEGEWPKRNDDVSLTLTNLDPAYDLVQQVPRDRQCTGTWSIVTPTDKCNLYS